MTLETVASEEFQEDDKFLEEGEEAEDLGALGLPKRQNSFQYRNKDLRTSRRMENATFKEEVVYDYDLKNFVHEKPMREWRFTLPSMNQPIIMNPVTTLIGIVPLWTATIWCMASPDEALDTFVTTRGNIARSFTWFVIITKPLSLFFLLWITYKYGDIKFGGRDAKPEFGNFEYFAMIFTTGVGVGMYYYGVSEPLWHQSSHWFAEAGYRSQDEIDQMAIVLTIYHWGFHAYTPYLTVAIATSLASYRFRLPLIFRSTFYPILGEYTWGYLGDLIDGISIVVTIAGICTSLGLGAIQMAAGVQRIGWLDSDLSEEETTDAQIVIIWLVTILTTASVLMGLSRGILYLSMLAFGLGIILSMAIFMMDQSAYLMNLMIQTVGYYFQIAIFQLPFHTDAYGQLRSGEGRATDGNASATWWFDAWTVFYWNWWVAWSVFVGLFVTRISYGRTLREITLYSLVAPVVYLWSWFCIWGGAGLRQARQALEMEQLGVTYFNDTEYYQSTENPLCYDVPQNDVMVEGVEDPIFTNYVPGVTPVCKFETTATAAFNVLYSFSFPQEWDTGYGPYLSVIFLIALATYFATSSDSGSLVTDILAANGRHNTHWIQRMFWALTEASVATALLSAGGSSALTALQAASIICGLPYTVILMFLLQSIWSMCEQAQDESRIHYELPRRQFIMPSYGGVFNVFEYLASFGRVHTARVVLGLDLPSNFQVTEFFTALFLPFLPLQDIVFTMYPKDHSRLTNCLLLMTYTICFFFWAVAFPMAIFKFPSMEYWGWAAYGVCTFLLAKMKNNVRARKRLHGNFIGDILSSLLVYPQVLTQIRIELLEYGSEQVTEDKHTKTKFRVSAAKQKGDNHKDLLGGASESVRSSRTRKNRQIGDNSESTRPRRRRNSKKDLLDDDSVASTALSVHSRNQPNPKRDFADDDASMQRSGHRRNNKQDFLDDDSSAALSVNSGHKRNSKSYFMDEANASGALSLSSRTPVHDAKASRRSDILTESASKESLLSTDNISTTKQNKRQQASRNSSNSSKTPPGIRTTAAPVRKSADDVRAELALFRQSQHGRTKPQKQKQSNPPPLEQAPPKEEKAVPGVVDC